MSKFNISILLFVFIMFSSCAAKKRAVEFENQPSWVKQKPVITGYFVGVGSAKKVGIPAEYIEKTRQDALADLASEVSVNVSTLSVLHTIETQYGNTNFFDQRIEIEAADYLEGFEPVEKYENDVSYWVYYRIKKSTYYDAKEKKKKAAIANAKAKYLAGSESQKLLNPREAITYYLQGLSSIKQYLGEETPIELFGKKTDIGNKLFSTLNSALSSFSIKPVMKKVVATHGLRPSQNPQFIVNFKGEHAVGIPVSANYSGGYLNNNSLITDQEGKITVDPGNIHSKNKQEQINASINFVDIANKATDDLFIRGLINNFIVESTPVVIDISMPNLAISIGENFCETNNCESIIILFEKNALKSGYLIDKSDFADYTFQLELQYVDGEKAGGMTSVYLKGNMKLLNSKNDLIWAKKINPIKGVDLSIKKAKEEAFTTLLKNLNLIYFRQGIEEID